jgi:hypothetical protein
MVSVIDFGSVSFTGVFPQSKEKEVPQGKLNVLFCQFCNLAQLADSFPSNELYGDNYGYRSGLNNSMVNHLENTVRRIENLVPLETGDVVCDIGSNDATLLNSYANSTLEKIGIDPTIIKYREYYKNDTLALADFFSAELYFKHFQKKAKVVTSVAMFYDLENPVQFAKDVHQILDDDGIWYFEQSYTPWVLRTGAFDTICHEHLEYYTLSTIKKILDLSNFDIVGVSTNSINGGSISVTASPRTGKPRLLPVHASWLLSMEEKHGYNSLDAWERFSKTVSNHKLDLLELLTQFKKEEQLTLGLGASTKGNVLLQFMGIGTELLPAIGEVNEYKWGRVTPGTHIPIVSETELLSRNPDNILILPWHFRETFVKALQPRLESGLKLILPLPEIELIGY